MTEAGSRDRASDVEAQILAEHREIREFGRRIEDSRDLVEILGILKEFRTVLEGHFRNEEAIEGFYDVLRQMSPRQLAKVDHLEKEHRALLADLDRVRECARACLAGPVAGVLGEAQALVRWLRAHEAAEDSLLLDTLYDDLGQGG